MGEEQGNDREIVNLTNERGESRAYETVASRLARFRTVHPDWTIHSKILYCDDEVVRIRVRMGYYTEAGHFVCLATGHAEEYRLDGKINATSALENCETSALGRALAFLGYGSPTSIASAEEVAKAKRSEKNNEEHSASLIVLQNAATEGDEALRRAWGDLTKSERGACSRYMPKLKRDAAKVDEARNS